MNELTISDQGFNYHDSWELLQLAAKHAINAGITKLGNPTQVAMVVIRGRGLGLGFFDSIENINIINNKTSITTDLALRLVEQSGLLVDKNTVYEAEGDARKCSVTVTRKDREPKTWSFTIKEARQAGLLGRKGSAWEAYPDSMLYARACGYALKREFADVLGGNVQVDEVPSEEGLPQAQEKQAVATEVKQEKNGKQKPVEPAPEPAPVVKEPVKETPIEVAPAPEEKPQMTFKVTEEGGVELKNLRTLMAENSMSDEDMMAVIHGLKLSAARSLEEVPIEKLGNLVKHFHIALQQHQRRAKAK